MSVVGSNATTTLASCSPQQLCPPKPPVRGAVKANRFVLQGNPNCDVSMSVQNDEFTIKYGKVVVFTVGQDNSSCYSGGGGSSGNGDCSPGCDTSLSQGSCNTSSGACSNLGVHFIKDVLFEGCSIFEGKLIARRCAIFQDHVSICGSLDVEGPITLDGAIDMTGDLAVVGNMSLTGNVTCDQLTLLGHPNSNVTMNVENDEFTLRYGNAVLLRVGPSDATLLTDDSMPESLLQIVKETLFTEDAMFEKSISVAGSATVGTTLSVAGIATFGSSVSVGGAAYFASSITGEQSMSVGGHVHLSQTLSVGGHVHLAQTLSVAGNVQVENIEVRQDAHVHRDIIMDRDMIINKHVAITSGVYNQAKGAIAIGYRAGEYDQQKSAVAIGTLAGQEKQGVHAVAVGAFAATTLQQPNSICLNATGFPLQTTTPGFYVKPIREVPHDDTLLSLFYDETSGEIVGSAIPGGTLSVSGPITGDLDVLSNATFYSPVIMHSTLSVSDSVYLSGDISVFGGVTLGSTLNVSNDVFLDASLSVGGNSWISDVSIADGKVTAPVMLTSQPAAVDSFTGVSTDGFYKMELVDGVNQWTGIYPFDVQSNYDNTTGFPSGQVAEYYNGLPLRFPAIIGRIATAAVLNTPGSGGNISQIISAFGNYVGVPFFKDQLIYDPCQMRTRKSGGTAWYFGGAPTIHRVAATRAMLSVKWFVKGEWSTSDPSNRLIVTINQYRNTVFLRSMVLQIIDSPLECVATGNRTLLTHSNLFGEDADWSTDDFSVEITNDSSSYTYTSELNQVELQFIIVQ